MNQALEILLRRKKVFVIPFLLVFIVPAIVTLIFMRTYEADCSVWFDSDVAFTPLLKEAGSQPDARPIQQAADTLQQLLRTRSFVGEIIGRTALRKKMRSRKEREQTIAYVQKNVSVDVIGPNTMKITFQASSGGDAVDVVKATTDSFVAWMRAQVKQENEKSVAFFEQQSQRYQKQLDGAIVALRDFREAHPEVRQLEIRDKVLNAPEVTVSSGVQSQFEQLKAAEEYARGLHESWLDDLAKDRVQAAAREARYLNGLRIVDKAVLPTGFSKKPLLLADFLAFAAAVIVGVAAVIVTELADHTFHVKRDVEEALELPVLVELERDRGDVRKA